MKKKEKSTVHTFVLFIITIFSGGGLIYILRGDKNENAYMKLILLFVFMISLYMSTKNWVRDNAKKDIDTDK